MSLEKIISFAEEKPSKKFLLQLIHQKKIKVKNKFICFEGKKIEWEKLKEKFKKGEVDEKTLTAIGVLRKATLQYLLDKLRIDATKCYTEIGSTTPTSDLDFTFVNYKTPEQTVDLLKQFSTLFKDLYGNYSDKTFDTNFYILEMLIDDSCYKIVDPKLKPYFTEIGKNIYNFLYLKDKASRLINYKLTFQVQLNQLNLIKKKKKKSNLKKLLKFATQFYNTLHILVNNPKNKKDILLYLRVLSYFITLHSNEAYISDITLKLILFQIPLKNEQERMIAFVDQYLFIYEWYHIYQYQPEKLLAFFDVVSKYIHRCKLCLDGSRLASLIPPKLFEYATYWKKEIRGKVSLEDAMKLQKTKTIQSYLGDMQKVMNYFHNVFRKIKRNLEDKNCKKIVNEISTNVLLLKNK
jgi:hypothetical protein